MKITTFISISAYLMAANGSIFCMQNDISSPVISMDNFNQEAFYLDHLTLAEKELIELELFNLYKSNPTENKPTRPALEVDTSTLMHQVAPAPAPNPVVRAATTALHAAYNKNSAATSTLKKRTDKIAALEQEVQSLKQALYNEKQKYPQPQSEVPSTNNERVLVPAKTSKRNPWDDQVVKFTLKIQKSPKKLTQSRATSSSKPQ